MAADDPTGIKHERWSSRIDFVLACTGVCIGYGNVWRFPYLVYKSGGGAFFIPFLISVFFAGISVFFLEVVQGQFMSGGAVKVWNMAPLFRGIGWAAVVLLFYTTCYYNILLMWSIRYFAASFTAVLPWQNCNNDWNTDTCISDKPISILNETANATFYLSARNVSFPDVSVLTDSSTEYWENNVLGISDGIEAVGNIKPDLLVCLIVAWIVVFVCISNGIKTSGKIMYVTATAPYVLIFILIVRGLMLPGAAEGVKFYLKPDFSKLLEIRVWADAGAQVFYSYCFSLGILQTLGACNSWRHNSLRDCIIFSGIDTFTCFIAGIVIFPYLGFMAHQKGVPISEVAEQGPGLVFVVYPKAVSLMPLAPLWAVLFFAMLIFVGIDSQFVCVEAFVADVSDMLPQLTKTCLRRVGFTAAICAICFLIDLSMITNGGMYLFQLIYNYSGCRIILLVAFAECAVVAWVYGAGRFCNNIEAMWGHPIWTPLRVWLKVTWTYIAPPYFLLIFALNTYLYSQDLTYKRSPTLTYHFPQWAITLGWVLAYSSAVAIPVVAAVEVLKLPNEMRFIERLKHLVKPVLKPFMVLESDSSNSYILDESWECPTKLQQDRGGKVSVALLPADSKIVELNLASEKA